MKKTKTKRILSILLAIIIATSCMAGLSVFSAGAATTENTIKDTKVYFEFPADLWKNYEFRIDTTKNTTNVNPYVESVYGDDEYMTDSRGSAFWACSAKKL